MIKKTLLKTLSYAAMHMSISIGVAYALSRSWKVALAIGLAEPCAQIIGFFFHERAWHRIEHGAAHKAPLEEVVDGLSPMARIVEKMLRHRH